MAENLANYVKFLRGTPTAYAALPSKDKDTLYFITAPDSSVGKIYLGEVLVAGSVTDDGTSIIDSLAELVDVDLTGLVNGNILGYDGAKDKWVPMTLPEAITYSRMVGASQDEAGSEGLVPAPQAGDQNKFLRGDGSWAEIDIPEVPAAQVFEATLAIVDNVKEDHMVAIGKVVGSASLTIGDIAIVKDPIDDSKFQYTAYVYNGTDWAAMDGNYNANNVYFDEDFTFTKSIGTVTVSSGNKKVDAKGKNLKQFFAGLFAAEEESTVTVPTVSAFTINKSGSYEAGTVLTNITYSATFEDGKYTYGPEPTGSTVTGWSIKDKSGNVIGSSNSGSLADYTVPGDSSFYLKATADYSDGSYANTNLGNASKTKRIVAGTTVSKESNKINGYWQYFYGVLDTSVKSDVAANVTSAFIRENLTHGGAYAAGTLNLNAHEGAKCLIVACPASKSGVTEAIMPSALQSPIPWVDGSPFTVSVEGATNAVSTNYNVWIYEPASIDATETYKITLG